MSIPGGGLANRFLEHDLNLSRGTFLDDASSFSAWAGFGRTTLSGGDLSPHDINITGRANTSVTTWGNRIIGGPEDLRGKYVFRGKAGYMGVANTLEDLVYAQGTSPKGWKGPLEKIRFAGGWRGFQGLLGAAFVANDFRRALQEGEGVLGAAGSAAAYAVKEVLMWKAIRLAVTNPYTLIPAVAGVGAAATFIAKDQGNKYLRQRRMSEMSGRQDSAFQTRPAYTMRQRALNSIAQSRFNAGRALGNEGVWSAMPRVRYGNTYGPTMPPMAGL